jgi:hypothetical protein
LERQAAQNSGFGLLQVRQFQDRLRCSHYLALRQTNGPRCGEEHGALRGHLTSSAFLLPMPARRNKLSRAVTDRLLQKSDVDMNT